MMKKLMALLLALCLCLSAMALADADDALYTSDFTKGLDGWYARSTGEAKVMALSGGLFTSGRAADWHSPGHDFDLEAGKTYWFSVDVVQRGDAPTEFILSIAHSKDGQETYENLGRATAAAGTWTNITGQWTAGDYDRYTLYVETANAPTLSFSIDNFQVLTSEPGQSPFAKYGGEMPSLKELYAEYFDFGTCMSRMDVQTSARTALVKQQYSIITPENELKPDAVLDVFNSRKLAKEDDTAVAVHFSSAKPLMDFASANGIKLHGHVLVWHSQTPEEFFHVGYDTKQPYVTREVMLARLDNYIRQVFEYIEANYPGLFVSFDVANECVADGSSNLRASNWTKVVGQDFVCRAFEIADKYAPDYIKLYYNDYSTPYEPKLTGIVKLLTSLVEEGHIDGYGFQSHYGSGEPSMSAIENAFRKIAALDLRLRVSELDLTVSKDNAAGRTAQAKRYGELMKLYLSYADRMDAVQVWGVSDGTSWIRDKYPLMFDASLNPKPSFFSVVEAVGK